VVEEEEIRGGGGEEEDEGGRDGRTEEVWNRCRREGRAHITDMRISSKVKWKSN